MSTPPLGPPPDPPPDPPPTTRTTRIDPSVLEKNSIQVNSSSSSSSRSDQSLTIAGHARPPARSFKVWRLGHPATVITRENILFLEGWVVFANGPEYVDTSPLSTKTDIVSLPAHTVSRIEEVYFDGDTPSNSDS